MFETRPLRFLFDYPFVLGVELGATLQADGDEEPLTAASQLGNTLEWDVFVEVRDSGGEVVEGYTIDSLTGIDWALPFPEPQRAGPAALATLAWIGARSARARRRAAARARASQVSTRSAGSRQSSRAKPSACCTSGTRWVSMGGHDRERLGLRGEARRGK